MGAAIAGNAHVPEIPAALVSDRLEVGRLLELLLLGYSLIARLNGHALVQSEKVEPPVGDRAPINST